MIYSVLQKLLQLELFRNGVRYVIGGAWNTVFGIGCYTVLIIIFGQEHYLLLGLFSNILAITNAFLCYKYFVFKSKGPFWQEYFRCYLVYGSNMLIGMAEMYVCVSLLGFDAICSNLAVTVINFVVSYFGHKYFSFRNGKKKIIADSGREAEQRLKTDSQEKSAN